MRVMHVMHVMHLFVAIATGPRSIHNPAWPWQCFWKTDKNLRGIEYVCYMHMIDFYYYYYHYYNSYHYHYHYHSIIYIMCLHIYIYIIYYIYIYISYLHSYIYIYTIHICNDMQYNTYPPTPAVAGERVKGLTFVKQFDKTCRGPGLGPIRPSLPWCFGAAAASLNLGCRTAGKGKVCS